LDHAEGAGPFFIKSSGVKERLKQENVKRKGNSFIFAPPKKRIMAKEQKEETIVNVQEVYTKAEVFVDKNRKRLFTGLGIVGALFAGFFAYQYLIAKPKEAKAAVAMWQAQYWFEKDSMELALNGGADFEGFDAIISNYSGTKAAKQAHYAAGIIYRDKGEYETAITHFKEADFNDASVGVLSTGNIGDCYIQLGNIEEGASYLEKAAKMADKADSRDFLAPIYLLKASKAFLELNKADKAKNLLTMATENYDKKSQEYNEAAKLLAMLKAQE
jgi:tetratricopeptide (TPR) repeat protein